MVRRAFLSPLQKAEDPAINITPLIDVVFVLLIAFIVIAPLVEADRVELASSKHVASHIPLRMDDPSHIQIYVLPDNSILCSQENGSQESGNKEKVPLDKLEFTISKLKQLYPNDRPQIFHDKKAHFGVYQEIKNTLEKQGFQEMDIILSP